MPFKNKSHHIILILLCLIIILCVIINYVRSNEAFDDNIPDYCGTAGRGYSDGALQFFKSLPMIDDSSYTKLKSTRLYTPSECAKLDNSFYNKMNECDKLKNSSEKAEGSNIEFNYSNKCGGLNKLPSVPPSECSADGVYLGVNNKSYMIDGPKGKLIQKDNSYRYYTKAECDKLNGQFVLITHNGSDEDKKSFIANNSKDLGTCHMKNGGELELICYSSEEPTMLGEASSVLKKHIKNYLDL